MKCDSSQAAFTPAWHQRTRYVLISPSCIGPRYLEASVSVRTLWHFAYVCKKIKNQKWHYGKKDAGVPRDW